MISLGFGAIQRHPFSRTRLPFSGMNLAVKGTPQNFAEMMLKNIRGSPYFDFVKNHPASKIL